MPNATPTGYNTVSTITLSNIRVTNCSGQMITDYLIVAADAETTNKGEVWEAITNGGNWIMIDMMPSAEGNNLIHHPKVDGVGTQDVTELGEGTAKDVNMQYISSGVFLTSAPTQLTFNLTTNLSREGVAIGIIIADDTVLLQSTRSSNKIVHVYPCLNACYQVEPDGCEAVLVNSATNTCTTITYGKLGRYTIEDGCLCVDCYGQLQPWASDTMTVQITCNQTSYTKQITFIYRPDRCGY